jgi:hypothetical protein
VYHLAYASCGVHSEKENMFIRFDIILTLRVMNR